MRDWFQEKTKRNEAYFDHGLTAKKRLSDTDSKETSINIDEERGSIRRARLDQKSAARSEEHGSIWKSTIPIWESTIQSVQEISDRYRRALTDKINRYRRTLTDKINRYRRTLIL